MSVSESQVRKLFFVIQNSYDYFDDNDDKVMLWMDFLKDTSFELAQANLRTYIMNPENKKPPHPGIIAATEVQQADGPYVPGVEETLKLLTNLEEHKRRAVPMPEHIRLMFKNGGQLSAGSENTVS